MATGTPGRSHSGPQGPTTAGGEPPAAAEYLTAAQAAARLQMSRHTVLRLLRAGGLPGRKVGRQWRLPAAGLRAWMEKRDGAH